MEKPTDPRAVQVRAVRWRPQAQRSACTTQTRR
jgi:hypothetical protein